MQNPEIPENHTDSKAAGHELSPWLKEHLTQVNLRANRMTGHKPVMADRTLSLLRQITERHQPGAHRPADMPLSRPLEIKEKGHQPEPSGWGSLVLLLSQSHGNAFANDNRVTHTVNRTVQPGISRPKAPQSVPVSRPVLSPLPGPVRRPPVAGIVRGRIEEETVRRGIQPPSSEKNASIPQSVETGPEAKNAETLKVSPSSQKPPDNRQQVSRDTARGNGDSRLGDLPAGPETVASGQDEISLPGEPHNSTVPSNDNRPESGKKALSGENTPVMRANKNEGKPIVSVTPRPSAGQQAGGNNVPREKQGPAVRIVSPEPAEQPGVKEPVEKSHHAMPLPRGENTGISPAVSAEKLKEVRVFPVTEEHKGYQPSEAGQQPAEPSQPEFIEDAANGGDKINDIPGDIPQKTVSAGNQSGHVMPQVTGVRGLPHTSPAGKAVPETATEQPAVPRKRSGIDLRPVLNRIFRRRSSGAAPKAAPPQVPLAAVPDKEPISMPLVRRFSSSHQPEISQPGHFDPHNTEAEQPQKAAIAESPIPEPPDTGTDTPHVLAEYETVQALASAEETPVMPSLESGDSGLKVSPALSAGESVSRTVAEI
ncbi:MAG: hypothetical protein JXA46_15380, partial [Dehalococcoidales bacterium]|nr:hypothetical protein [Dehalococcoidales bacterium]